MSQNVLPANIPSLTGLRAIAALSVVLFHFTMSYETIGFLPNVFRNGWLGVDLFFVLSGFIIHHVYRTTFDTVIDRAAYFRFLLLRLARIYPVHIATLLLALTFSLTATALGLQAARDYNFAAGTIASILLVHGWLGVVGPNNVSWSVSAEWFAYLCYPAFCWISARLKPKPSVMVVVGLLVILHWGSEQNALLRVIPEFVVGMFAYGVATRFYRQRIRWRWTGIAIAFFALAWELIVDDPAVVLHALIFATMILALTQPEDYLARILSIRPFVYIGEISYSLYLIHSLVGSGFHLVEKHLSFEPDGLVRVSGKVALSIAAAAILYHAVELPARALIRRATLARQPAANLRAAGVSD